MPPKKPAKGKQTGHGELDEPINIQEMLDSLPEDQKTMVKLLHALSKQSIPEELKSLKESLLEKDTEIQDLRNEVMSLKSQMSRFEQQLDDQEQYSRRDCIVVAGPKLPEESEDTSTTEQLIGVIKQELGITIDSKEISISHRLGKKNNESSKPRPIIAKLVNRSLKHVLVDACITKTPELYINESLTSKRAKIFGKLRGVRSKHKNLIQQCYTSEGIIYVKLMNSTVKHRITNEETLMKFLDIPEHSVLKEEYLKLLEDSQPRIEA